MVVLDALTVSNFKRYAGTHRIPLSPEEGTLTIVAAQNGVGKTSLIDALHVGLWGKRGYMARHPGEDRGRFDRWLANAFAVGAEEDYPHLRFAVDVSVQSTETSALNAFIGCWTAKSPKNSE